MNSTYIVLYLPLIIIMYLYLYQQNTLLYLYDLVATFIYLIKINLYVIIKRLKYS